MSENSPQRNASARRLARGIGAAAFDKVVILGLQLGLVPVLVSSWGVHLYGVWLMLSTLPSYLALSDLGFATAAGNDMTMRVAVGDRARAIVTFQSAWAIILTTSLALITAGLTAIWILPDSLVTFAPMDTEEVRITLTFLLLYGALSLQNSLILAGFRAEGNFATGRAGTAFMYMGEGCVVLVTVIAGGRPIHVAISSAAWRLLGVCGMAFLLRRKSPWLIFGLSRVQLQEARRLFAPASAAMMLPFSEALLLQGTALAVGAAASPTAVVLFTTVRTLSRIGIQLTTLLSHPLMPEFSAATARGDRTSMTTMYAMVITVSAIVLLPFLIGFLLLGPWAVGRWTHGLVSPPWHLFLIMAAVVLANGFWSPIANLILAMNKHEEYSLFYLTCTGVGVVIAYILSSVIGAPGGGIAMLGVDAIMLIWVHRLASRAIAPDGTLLMAFPSLFVRARNMLLAALQKVG